MQLGNTWSGLRASQPQSEGGVMLTPGLLRMDAQGGWKQPCCLLPRQPRWGMQCTAVKPLPATPVTGFLGWPGRGDAALLYWDGRPLQGLIGLAALPCDLWLTTLCKPTRWNECFTRSQGCWQQQQQSESYHHPAAVWVQPANVKALHSTTPYTTDSICQAFCE